LILSFQLGLSRWYLKRKKNNPWLQGKIQKEIHREHFGEYAQYLVSISNWEIDIKNDSEQKNTTQG
jgi:hypothetical protein